MNEYNFNVKFEKGRITSNLKKLVQNDYNSTKINFTFDKKGRKVFKMLLPDGTPYVTNIENDELVFGKGVLSQDGTYEVEIALYTEDGRLTDYATVKFEVRAELIQTDEIIELDDRLPILDNLIQEATKIKTDAETGAFNGKDGKDGKDGITPTIGTNGNWFIGMQDTGLPSRGEKGEKGESGGVSIEDVEEYVNNALENIESGGSTSFYRIETTDYIVDANNSWNLEFANLLTPILQENLDKPFLLEVNDANNKSVLFNIFYATPTKDLSNKTQYIYGVHFNSDGNFMFKQFVLKIYYTSSTGVIRVDNVQGKSEWNTCATKKYVDDTVSDAIENIEISGGEGGEDPFIHLDLIVDYASAGSNPLPINSTKNTSELEKLSNLVNEYVANPKPILLSVFNSIGTVYRDHYNILVTTFGMAITATAKNPSLKYTILNGYKATPFTLSISGTWSDGVYTCTSASITYDNTKDLMGTTEFSTITGRKVFNTLPETNVKATSNSQFTNKQYVDDAIKAAITTVLEGEY